MTIDPALAERLLATLPGGAPTKAAEPQPVSVMYGGAHLFRANTPHKLGELARRAFVEHDAESAFELEPSVRDEVLARVERKLAHEPIEDLRIDFEDGFGVRSEDEEDETAVRTAKALAEVAAREDRPRHIGIRIKALDGATAARAVRTLDRFVTTLATIPPRFVVTLPKVTDEQSVTVLATLLDHLEERLGAAPGAVGIELMVEHPRALYREDGRLALPGLVHAARGRCVAAHLGTYDLTSAIGVAAVQQTPDHPFADFARQIMLVSLAGSGVRLSDGATTVLPIGSDRAIVHAAWRRHFTDVRRALRFGIYQSWDLHPAQLVSHYTALFSFFREALPSSSSRLRTFVEHAARASRVGEVFDDAATGQGLLNFFLRGVECGAIDGSELALTGVTEDDLRVRSFAAMVDRRR
jgi:citrate lyase beta subunit